MFPIEAWKYLICGYHRDKNCFSCDWSSAMLLDQRRAGSHKCVACVVREWLLGWKVSASVDLSPGCLYDSWLYKKVYRVVQNLSPPPSGPKLERPHQDWLYHLIIHVHLRWVRTLVGHFWYRKISTFSNAYGLTRLCVCVIGMPWSNFIGICAQTRFIRNVEIFTVSENAIFAKIRNLVQKCLKRWKVFDT